MKLIIAYRKDIYKDIEVPSYANSYVREFKALGHEVLTLGQNQDVPLDKLSTIDLSRYDYLLDIDNGRNPDGTMTWAGYDLVKNLPTGATKAAPIKTAVIWIDSHGPAGSSHHRMAPYYTHVFFAVWARRDIFAKHKSAYFLPNATDLDWFHVNEDIEPEFDFGFFGSKNGLDRADPMIEVCKKNDWTYDVRQIAKAYRPKWPMTGNAMNACRFLFNKGQKLDLNLRIFESGAVKKPLLCDFDSKSGIDNLFTPWKHFIPYNRLTLEGLEEGMNWLVSNPKDAILMANNMYQEVESKHLIKHRVRSILEIIT